MLTRRGLLGRVGRCAPLLAAGGVLGRFAAPLPALAPKATAISQEALLPEAPHPAVVGWVEGEEVYDQALVVYRDGDGWMARAPGQTWHEAQVIGRQAILVRTNVSGQIARWAINDAMQIRAGLQARFHPLTSITALSP